MGVDKATGALEEGKNFGMRECRRYITSHNEEAKAIFLDEPRLLWQDVGEVAGTRGYATGSIPADMSNDNDLKAYLAEDETSPTSRSFLSSPVVPGGVGITVVNFKPGSRTGMHRTISLDCSVCLEGHIRMETDSGETRDLFPGVSFANIKIIRTGIADMACRIMSSSVERPIDGSIC